jgi:hypothetical protein
MKVGDLVKYRERIPTDPEPSIVGDLGAWGNIGIVIEVFSMRWGNEKIPTPSIEYVDFNGDKIICKTVEVEVINV